MASEGVACITTLILDDVLFVINFPVNLLAISQITKHNSYSVIFFLSTVFFLTFKLGENWYRPWVMGDVLSKWWEFTYRICCSFLILVYSDINALNILRLLLLVAYGIFRLDCESCELGKHYYGSYVVESINIVLSHLN